MEQEKEQEKKNQNKTKKWEYCFAAVLMLLFGFWIGFIFRGSGSWAVQFLLEHDFSINFAVILAVLPVLYLVITIIVEHHESKKKSK